MPHSISSGAVSSRNSSSHVSGVTLGYLSRTYLSNRQSLLNIINPITYEEYNLLGCNSAQIRENPTFWHNTSHPSSGLRSKHGEDAAYFCWFLVWLVLQP
jgi:hypothetical protein